MTVKTKKLFFSASEPPRTVLNEFLECLYFEFLTEWRSYTLMDIAYMDGRRLYGRRLDGRRLYGRCL